jgi:hypothetical protein
MPDYMIESEKEKKYHKLFIRLSGHFLSAHLPDDFFTYEEEDQMQFIADHAWQPFEYHEPEDVYDLIDNLTYEVMNIIEKGIE